MSVNSNLSTVRAFRRSSSDSNIDYLPTGNTTVESDRFVNDVSILYLVLKKKKEETEEVFDKRKKLYEAAAIKHNMSVFEDPYYDSGFDVFQPGKPPAPSTGGEEKNANSTGYIREYPELSEGTHVLGLGIHGAMYRFSVLDNDELKNCIIGCTQGITPRELQKEGKQTYIDTLLSGWSIGKFKTFVRSGYINPEPYYLYPRSSIYKKSFRLANSAGIIDSGYRGEMGALVDVNHKLGRMGDVTGTHDGLRNRVIPHERYFQICKGNLSKFYVSVTLEKLPDTKRGEGGFGSTGR